MNFKLNPPSGLADSYLDIEFHVAYEKSPKTILTIRNKNSNEQLNILGVSSGYILDGNTAVIKETAKMSGHINIFNDDKMNKKFVSYGNVEIVCNLEHFDSEGNSTGTEEKSVFFYNEGQSLDSEIIPFDLIVKNNEIDIDSNEPLKIELISGIERGYEICIQSTDKKIVCHLEISAKMGKTEIRIPLEFLYHDLDLKIYKNKKFVINYVKHQGSTYSRLVNRKYIPLNSIPLKFTGSKDFTPLPQSRLGPTGKAMSTNFILSDRYLVICPQEYSGFSGKISFSPKKLMDLTMMVNEGQHMEYLSRQMQAFSSDKTDDTEKIKKTQRAIQNSKSAGFPKTSTSQMQLMRSISGAYEPVSSNPAVSNNAVTSFAAAQNTKSSGCAPCARKRKKNA